MSTKKKPKKFRTPNVPMEAASALGGGLESSSAPRAAPGTAQFDYTYVRQDLRRIGLLAGSIIAILVVLSFFIN
jgi:hypothetical protein